MSLPCIVYVNKYVKTKKLPKGGAKIVVNLQCACKSQKPRLIKIMAEEFLFKCIINFKLIKHMTKILVSNFIFAGPRI